MKKLFLCVAIATFAMSNLTAQEQAIKVNPLGLAFGIANAGYEFSTNETQTLTIAGLYYNISDLSGLGAGLEYRFYFSSGEALRGWHAGPSVGYFSLEDNVNNSAGFFSIGGEAGHQWIFGEHFALDVFAGLGYVAGNSDDLAVSLNAAAVSLGVSLGYAW
jgi:hypothetical protein